MAAQDNGGSSVNIVAILAIVILVAGAAWFFMGQKPRPAATTPAPTATEEQKSDVEIKVDLPDSIKIDP